MSGKNQVTQLEKRIAELEQENLLLKEKVDFLTRKLFGRSTEQTSSLGIEGQMSLFDEAEVSVSPDAYEPNLKDVGSYRRKKFRGQREALLKDIPHEKKLCTLAEEDRFCETCGTALYPVGEEFVRTEIEFIPAKVRVIDYYRETYECRQCRKEGKEYMEKSPMPYPVIQHSYASPSTVAHVIHHKYELAVPLYRQEKEWENLGVKLTRATMSNWLMVSYRDWLSPVVNLLKEKLLEQHYIHKVVVPTNLELAFNPDGYDITLSDGSTTVDDQIVSVNYGVMNLSSKDKTMKVAITATDKNATGENKVIDFVATEAEATDVGDAYAIYLAAAPVDITGHSLTKDSTTSDLAALAGTVSETDNVAITGSGAIGFNLEAAEYTQNSTALGTGTEGDSQAKENDASGSFDLTAINTNSVAAFTLTGVMNEQCDWSTITEGITVGVTYTFTDYDPEEAPSYGVTTLTAEPTFASNEVLKIAYTEGMGDDALYEITSVTADLKGTLFDIKKVLANGWNEATVADGTISFDSGILKFWTTDTVEVTVNYTYGADGANEGSKTVTLKLKEAVSEP